MIRLLLAGAIFVVLGHAARSEAPAYTSSIFRSYETRFDDTSGFRKWISMLERKFAQQAELDRRGCNFGPTEACGPYYWRKFVAEIVNDEPFSKIEKVNAYLNKFRYVTDFANWGEADFWETPLEFLQRLGDCEDYAITKYFTLKKLGFNPDKMRIVALHDVNLRIGHAVLAIDHGAHSYILDNQIRKVTDARDILHYRALYSINESYWWKHIYK